MKKNYGKPKSAIDLVRGQKRSEAMKQSSHRRNTPKNFFPLVPAREGCWNPMGLTLNRDDCKVLNAVQKGAKTIKQICEVGHITPKKIRERLELNPDLIKGFSLLMKWKLAIAGPGNVDALIENSSESPAWMKLFLETIGAIREEATLRIIEKVEPDNDPLPTDADIRRVITWRPK